MAEQTEPIEPDSAPPAESASTSATAPTAPTEALPPAASAPSSSSTAAALPAARRSVTLPLLPVAIVGGVIVALLFFGGGVAIGYGVASHDSRSDNAQQFRGGYPGERFGDGNGFAPGQNQGRPNQGDEKRPGDRPTTAPNNG